MSKYAVQALQAATCNSVRATSVCYCCFVLFSALSTEEVVLKYLCEEDIAIMTNSVRDVIN